MAYLTCLPVTNHHCVSHNDNDETRVSSLLLLPSLSPSLSPLSKPLSSPSLSPSRRECRRCRRCRHRHRRRHHCRHHLRCCLTSSCHVVSLSVVPLTLSFFVGHAVVILPLSRCIAVSSLPSLCWLCCCCQLALVIAIYCFLIVVSSRRVAVLSSPSIASGLLCPCVAVSSLPSIAV
jgi:hypothetical protein